MRYCVINSDRATPNEITPQRILRSMCQTSSITGFDKVYENWFVRPFGVKPKCINIKLEHDLAYYVHAVDSIRNIVHDTVF